MHFMRMLRVSICCLALTACSKDGIIVATLDSAGATPGYSSILAGTISIVTGELTSGNVPMSRSVLGSP